MSQDNTPLWETHRLVLMVMVTMIVVHKFSSHLCVPNFYYSTIFPHTTLTMSDIFNLSVIPHIWLAVFKQHHHPPANSAPHTQMHQPHNQYDVHGTYENHTAMNTSPAQVCDTECEHGR